MRVTTSLLAAGALALALSPLACASDPADDNIVTPTEEGSADDELRSLSLSEKDNGKTVTVTEGQNLLVKLQSNPSTGYGWQVSETDRTFGYPTKSFLSNGPGVGSGGQERFTWKTKSGPLTMVGSHVVKMEYKRPWEKDVAPSKTFSFTVKIVSGSCPQLSPPAPGFCKDGRIEPRKNDQGCTTGYDCIDDCRTQGCGGSQACSFCWGNFACIPHGAMC